MIHPVILSGGSGTRLWPVSRKSHPKQFAPLIGEESLFQASLRRLSGPEFAEPVVVTNAAFRFIVAEQLSEAGHERARILIEPEPRNTAPAVLCAALELAETPEALMLVAPSDHILRDTQGFAAALEAGAAAARQGRLVTFGIRPDRPETGYGYLELAGAPDSAPAPAPAAHELVRFVEKPDAGTAAAMLESGRFLWNAGIFLFRVGDLLAAFEAHAPALVPPCRAALAEGRDDLMFFRLGEAAFARAEAISIDYAVMERAANLSVVPLAGGWTDLGAWDAVWRESAQDGAGVATAGPVTALDCRQSLLRSEDPDLHLVGIGLADMIAVAMRDAVLIAPMAEAQRVREALSRLRQQGARQAEEFPRHHRPWGWYETLARGPRFQVKRIMVKPGAKLSLQAHHHRAEHWVVVAGTAHVTRDRAEQLLTENESIYIPLGAVHRLANPGKLELHLIEVQSGAYLGEDDIERYDDIYARG